jgi:aminopeptidase N
VLLSIAITPAACSRAEEMSTPDPEPGIALTLATERSRALTNLRYEVALDVPEAAADPVTGRVALRFELADAAGPLVLDFAPGGDHIRAVGANGRAAAFRAVNGHIVLPAGALTPGENVVTVEFVAGDASLNRNPEFLYALFVPARAHLAIPCFDQPDLKGRFSLELTVPAGWETIANGAEQSRTPVGDRVRIRFAETEPISTYLFAFAAGRFQVEAAVRNDRRFRMLHRETDAKKVERNRDAVFDLHASALAWLEEYTGIPYPFGKFDFVLMPAFQFSGMEHPGAVYYNANSILLDESATQSQMLGRASVIAHETAHMWFGDLVTMRWFDDVWMKEVFANFMASKIVNPAFPDVNHDLRFLTAHYPAAYAVDRTEGTHPIRQELVNLSEAGSLYGAIIYQKAPIVMRQLELLLGADRLRDGLRAYLGEFAFGNATWLDLVRLLDSRTERDLAAWSRAWVEQSGRPTIRTEVDADADGRIRSLAFVQADPIPGRGLQWTQQIEVLAGTPARLRTIPLALEGERSVVTLGDGPPQLGFVLPSGRGLAYGGLVLDEASRAFLLRHVADLTDPVARGAAWVALWEEMLGARVAPAAFVDALLAALGPESTELNVQLLVGYASEAFWRFLAPADRSTVAPRIERVLRQGLVRAPSASLKATYFSAFRRVVTTAEGTAFLERVWRRQEKVPGLTLAEPDEATMALELAVREVPGADTILDAQRERFDNPDRKARFEFVMPALSSRPDVRDQFFHSLADVQSRRREPWVAEGLVYLHHPLRAETSKQYVRPALEMLEEIRRTGDIFFPRNWLDATLGGHSSPDVAATVRQFLAERPEYPVRLRRIILQSADDLFRAAERR